MAVLVVFRIIFHAKVIVLAAFSIISEVIRFTSEVFRFTLDPLSTVLWEIGSIFVVARIILGDIINNLIIQMIP
ncbi:MAG: hypothetical protein D0531_13450 [Methylococcales bacterium]|nr:MAG: hypothetical protein D0531_13450 [Methylococcales bacterium]